MSDSNVVDLQSRRILRNTHRSGLARCLNCKHEWQAVAPVGTVSLECPACATFQGVFKGSSLTQYRQWQCRCGEFSFYVDVHGPYCCHCGTRPDLQFTPPAAS